MSFSAFLNKLVTTFDSQVNSVYLCTFIPSSESDKEVVR